MTTDKQRVVVLLTPETYEEFKQLAEKQGDSMSSIGRRLIIEWITQQKREKK